MARTTAFRPKRLADIDLEAVIGEYRRPHTGSDL